MTTSTKSTGKPDDIFFVTDGRVGYSTALFPKRKGLVMKKLFLVVFASVVLTACGANAEDIVFCDLQEVFKRFYKTLLAQDQVRQQAEDIKQERQEMENEITEVKVIIDTLRKDARDDALSEEIRENKRNELEEQLVGLQSKEREMRDFEKLRMKQLEQQNVRMSRKLFDEIHDVIIEYAKNEGYKAVIDRSGQSRAGMEVVLYMHANVDITANILAVLNQGREKTDEEIPKTGKEQE